LAAPHDFEWSLEHPVSLSNWLSRRVIHPVSDFREGSTRLKWLAQLERTQWLPRDELLQQQQARLHAILQIAYVNSAYYREHFDRVGFKVDGFSMEEFRRIPVLTKKVIRARTDDLISRRYRKKDLLWHKTGGSTGTSLTTYFAQPWRDVRNADAMRSDRWAGRIHGMKCAAIWGNPHLPVTMKQRLRAALLDRMMYLDTMLINDATLADFVVRWRREHPQIVFGHSHSIYILAAWLLERGITDLRPHGIIGTSMMLIQSERRVIEKAFGCKVTDRYGCEEVGLIACECERHQGMHINIEHLYIEFLREDGEPAAPGEEGKIVVTDLLNDAMPFIRYRVEDVGVPSARTCECGRGMPLMERVVGRTADYLRRTDGSLVAGVSLVERTLTAIEGIAQMQIIQGRIDQIELRIVRGDSFSEATVAQLLNEFRLVFGEQTRVDVEYVRDIAPETSGKYRFSICNV
jgi:phenylacetate-CoA ligase